MESLFTDYDLNIIALSRARDLPSEGNGLVVVARMVGGYHVRIFHRDGRIILDRDKNEFLPNYELSRKIDNARYNLAREHVLDINQKVDLIKKITSALGFNTFTDYVRNIIRERISLETYFERLDNRNRVCHEIYYFLVPALKNYIRKWLKCPEDIACKILIYRFPKRYPSKERLTPFPWYDPVALLYLTGILRSSSLSSNPQEALSKISYLIRRNKIDEIRQLENYDYKTALDLREFVSHTPQVFTQDVMSDAIREIRAVIEDFPQQWLDYYFGFNANTSSSSSKKEDNTAFAKLFFYRDIVDTALFSIFIPSVREAFQTTFYYEFNLYYFFKGPYAKDAYSFEDFITPSLKSPYDLKSLLSLFQNKNQPITFENPKEHSRQRYFEVNLPKKIAIRKEVLEASESMRIKDVIDIIEDARNDSVHYPESLVGKEKVLNILAHIYNFLSYLETNTFRSSHSSTISWRSNIDELRSTLYQGQ